MPQTSNCVLILKFHTFESAANVPFYCYFLLRLFYFFPTFVIVLVCSLLFHQAVLDNLYLLIQRQLRRQSKRFVSNLLVLHSNGIIITTIESLHTS